MIKHIIKLHNDMCADRRNDVLNYFGQYSHIGIQLTNGCNFVKSFNIIYR